MLKPPEDASDKTGYIREGGQDTNRVAKIAAWKEEQQNASTEKKPETSREKRKKMKSLPTFASAEEYAEMLDNDDDEDV